MKEIGKAETISDYNQQISYLEDILSTMEDLQTLFGKDKTFSDDYKDIQSQMNWIDEVQQELIDSREELRQARVKQNEEELMGMIYEFQKARL